MIVSAAVLLHIVPWAGHAAARSGSSPEPGGGGRWAGPPPAPCGSPPAAAARWPPPVPVPPPSPGNAALAHKTSALTSTKGTPRTQGKFLSACPAGLTWMTAFLSARGRFFASLSASSHSRITWAQRKRKRKTLIKLVNLLYRSVRFNTVWFHTWVKQVVALCGVDVMFARLSKNVWAAGGNIGPFLFE